MPPVFALTRKKMGEIYGARKRVSAVALLELNGVDDLVGQVGVLWRQVAQGRGTFGPYRGEEGGRCWV